MPIYFVPVGRVTVTLPLAAKFRRIQHSKLPVGYVSVKVVTSVRRYSVLSARVIFSSAVVISCVAGLTAMSTK